VYGEMFDRVRGLNNAEFEFPTYFNFFIKNRKVNIITTSEVEEKIRIVFQETLLGPKKEDYNIEDDYAADVPPGAYAHFKDEGDALDSMRKTMTIDSLIKFTKIVPGRGAKLGKNVSIKIKKNQFKTIEDQGKAESERFQIVDFKRKIADINSVCEIKVRGGINKKAVKLFEIPVFGVTMLGVSHGFDKMGSTTGFVLWMNRKGIMCDPPPDSSMLLERMGIPPQSIEGIILTHCHADHDAGTFQKILRQRQVKVYTTKTIRDSFLRKYAALTGFDTTFLASLFTFQQVKIGEPIHVHGGVIDFFYSLHVIPCIGFAAKYHSKSLIYSADTHTNKETIMRMFEEGNIGKQRCEQLANFPWNHDCILHELGVPPIHTPADILKALPDETKAKLFVVHASENAVPPDSGLKSAKERSTIRIEVEQDEQAASTEILSMMKSLEWLRPVLKNKEKVAEETLQNLVEITEQKEYPLGAKIIESGANMDRMIIILAGVAMEGTMDPSDNKRKREMDPQMDKFRCGHAFGVEAIIEPGTTHKSDITARTNIYTIEMEVAKLTEFLIAVESLDTAKKDLSLYLNRKSTDSWNAILKNERLQAILVEQNCINEFQQLLVKKEYKAQEKLITEGEPATEAFLVLEGQVFMFLDASVGENVPTTFRGSALGQTMSLVLQPGSFVGEINALFRGQDELSHIRVHAQTDCVVYSIEQSKLMTFLKRYPGIIFQLLDTYSLPVLN
jgi:CRP-like cAMP-binding protein/phosphoribosyl 1,2-cyclic phosphodiesterase